MSVSRFSAEIESTGTDQAGALSPLPVEPAKTLLALESGKRKAKEIPQRDRQTGKATLVMASHLAESRRRWIQRLQDTVAVCEVTERRALQQVVANLKPDILVLDLALPGFRRIRGLPDLQRLSPSTRILVLTDSPAEGEGIVALKAGAKAYCARTIDPEHLRRAVAAVQRGEIWAPRKLVPALIAELLSLIDSRKDEDRRAERDPRLESLTTRQRLIADMIGRGASNKEIANRLNISERTVKAHLTEAFRNVGVSDRLQLALLLRGYPRPSD